MVKNECKLKTRGYGVRAACAAGELGGRLRAAVCGLVLWCLLKVAVMGV